LQNQQAKIRNVKAVILVGSQDFGRCPLASRLRRALWPIADKNVLQCLVEHIAGQGIKKIVICCDDNDSDIRKYMEIPENSELEFLEEKLPRGTAGCLLDAACNHEDLLMVFHAGIVNLPDIDKMLEAHYSSDTDMTVMFNPACENDGQGDEFAQIYICESSVLEYIPKAGYCDIKETLVPQLVKAGRKIHAARLNKHVGNFISWHKYLQAIKDFLQNGIRRNWAVKHYHEHKENIWIASDAKVAPSARLFPPVMIGSRSTISEDAVIFGPTIIGADVHIGKGTLMSSIAVWDGAHVGPNCQITDCLLDKGVVVGAGTYANHKLLPKKKGFGFYAVNNIFKYISDRTRKLFGVSPQSQERTRKQITLTEVDSPVKYFGFTLVLICFLWSYWQPTIQDLWKLWIKSDEYSSGMLVPLMAVYVLWSRRQNLLECPVKPAFIWGTTVLIGSQAIRFFGVFFMFASAERLSMVLTIASLVLLLFGWRLFWKTVTVMLFLLLMLPLPMRVHSAIMLPLQHWATVSAVFCLEMLGYSVTPEGNVIHIGETTVAVAEACNGLRMITAFFVIIGWVTLIVRRSLWEKFIMLISSLPIALLCNTLRLTITAIAFTKLSGEKWSNAFHDFGGYAMMPIALAAIVGELWLIDKLTVVQDVHPAEEVIVKAHK